MVIAWRLPSDLPLHLLITRLEELSDTRTCLTLLLPIESQAMPIWSSESQFGLPFLSLSCMADLPLAVEFMHSKGRLKYVTLVPVSLCFLIRRTSDCLRV